MAHSVYFDGSFHTSNPFHAGYGVYDDTNGFELAGFEPAENSYQSEQNALKHAIRYCQLNGIIGDTVLFGDCLGLINNEKKNILRMGFIDIIWIPRLANKKADKLSKRASVNKKAKEKIQQPKTALSTEEIDKIKVGHKSQISTEEIISVMMKFPIEKRMQFIKELSRTSVSNERAYKNIFLGSHPRVKTVKCNVFLFLTKMLVHELVPKEHKERINNAKQPKKTKIHYFLKKINDNLKATNES